MDTQLLPVTSLSEREQEEIRSDAVRVWGLPDAQISPAVYGADPHPGAPPVWVVLVKSAGCVVSHAGVLQRVVLVGDQGVHVGGIGGVMTLPEWRRRGW